ncbi:MAG: AbrB/MazE/SpoVT family DNA-binding domain-containing protein [Methanobacteriota archaeon]|nr:MAG: AbrB/MazE/SpoVT family DNA-binding domain-containing protein [Euryarchaeota archaeon]
MIAKISSKGQLTIPKKIRTRLKLKAGDRIKFTINEDGRIEITPVRISLKELRGMLSPPKQTISLQEMEEAIHTEGGKL